MKEIIQLLTTSASDPNTFDPAQIINTVSKLAEHLNKAKANDVQSEDEIHITWFTNNATTLPFIKHILNEADLSDHVTLRAVDDTLTEDIDEWEDDLRTEARSLIPQTAIECLAPDSLDDLPILYYGLQACGSDLVELLRNEEWHADFYKLLPSTHSDKALTWLYFLQNDADCEWNERDAQDYLIEASALSCFLHRFEVVVENSFFNFCAESVIDALPLLDSAYVTLRLNEEDKQQVLNALEEANGQLSYAFHEALRLVSCQYAGKSLATASRYLGSDAGVFYTLWSSIWPHDALLQADRFVNVLDTIEERRLKLEGYELVNSIAIKSKN